MYILFSGGIDLSGVIYMGYRIEYPGIPVRWHPEKLNWVRVFLYSAFFFGLLVLPVCVFSTEGREVLMGWIYPGDPALTRQALIQMAARLRAGVELEDAALAFCREILNGA